MPASRIAGFARDPSATPGRAEGVKTHAASAAGASASASTNAASEDLTADKCSARVTVGAAAGRAGARSAPRRGLRRATPRPWCRARGLSRRACRPPRRCTCGAASSADEARSSPALAWSPYARPLPAPAAPRRLPGPQTGRGGRRSWRREGVRPGPRRGRAGASTPPSGLGWLLWRAVLAPEHEADRHAGEPGVRGAGLDREPR
jgi:hypothetical protein